MKKIILHLCADLGSDSYYYQQNTDEYEVILIGESIGVENYHPPANVHGIIANPVCTEFQTINGHGKINDSKKAMFLVDHCIRIIEKANPVWFVIENPARGELKKFIGKPDYTYQPWQFGASWTKATALWGSFNHPKKLYKKWEDVPNKLPLYTRPNRGKPNLAFLHKSSVDLIPEMQWAKEHIKCDADIRSMCCRGFAEQFYLSNR